jgi:hypothetical protein
MGSNGAVDLQWRLLAAIERLGINEAFKNQWS